ncbi:MAG: PAS domain-containing protein, partial [Chloroflexota bacterium]
MPNEHRQPRGRDSLRFPLFVTVVYAVTAGLWILLSDKAVAGLFPPAEVVARIQTFKGLGAVAVTTTVLFVLLYHQSRRQTEIEQELRESEEKFAAAFRGSPIGLVISTIAGVMVEVNQAFCGLTDFKREELLGETSVNIGFFTPEARRELVDAIEREGGRVTDHEQTFPDRHGAPRTVLLSTETITLRGEPHLVTTTLDITERKQREEALRESEEKFAAAFHASPIGIAITTMAGKVVEVNQSFCKLMGYTREELVGKTSVGLGVFTAEGRQEFTDSIRRGGGRVTNAEWTFSDRHGNSRTFLYSTETISFRGEPHFLTTCLDVTERKRVEEALNNERDLLHALMDNIPDAIYFKDTASRFTQINEAQARLLGCDEPEEALGKADFDFYSPEFAKETFDDEQRIVETGQPVVGKVEQLKWPDGKDRWASVTKVPIRDGSGQVIGTVGITRDITERKKAEEALRSREQELRVIAESIPALYAYVDADGHFLFVNNRYVAWF